MTRFPTSLTPPFPPILHDEIGCAHFRALELAAKDRELHFACEGSGRVVVELRTLAGRPLGQIPAALALEIINGGDLDEVLGAFEPSGEPPPRPAN